MAGLVLAVLTAMVLGRALNACEGGVNNAANSTFLLFLFIPGLWAVLTLAWIAVGALLGNRPSLHAAALVVVLLVLCWCAVSLFWGETYACPGGAPPWWPSFVPTPGF
ncbi:hypothetical protein [Streptomyces sp. NPDC057689]|uniref:hypothetical protein n=1 Tax=Streptomyces sp. NPDC057689 TaxID=3346213 RepID=UPI0036C61893